MHRFYIPPENWNPDALVLTGSEAHHLRHVLRMKRGDQVVVFNGQGREITAEIIHSTRDEIRLRKLREMETPRSGCRITLGQAIPKGKNMELIVQKAVELGAAEIAPLISARTIVDLHGRELARKQAKWQQVAIEAAKQCGQNWLPRIQAPRSFRDFFLDVAAVAGRRSNSTFDLHLIGSLQPDAQHLKMILTRYAAEHQNRGASSAVPSSPSGRGIKGEGKHFSATDPNSRPRNVLMLVGPEGDFTPDELALAKSHNCIPITFGPIVLRVETAAIYCLSILSYELTGL